VPLPFKHTTDSKQFINSNGEEVAILFAENFVKLQGRFSFCASLEEVILNINQLIATRNLENIFCEEEVLKADLINSGFSAINELSVLNDCDACITTCESLVARTGSIVLSSAQTKGRTASVYAPIHICIAYSNQLVFDIKDGLDQIKTKYQNNIPSLIAFASGPSRTADIEKTLVVGVHGPKEVFCFLIDK
jgi:L-lactate dehydrogenase complex protein LldG